MCVTLPSVAKRVSPSGGRPMGASTAAAGPASATVEDAIMKMVDGVRQIGVTDRKPKKPGEDAPQSQFSFYDRPDPILPPK